MVMIVLIILSGPRGVFMKENGYNWMSASGMYVLLDSSPFMDGPVMDG
jgi:hypothetical protein